MHHAQASDVAKNAALLNAQALDGPQRARVLDAQAHWAQKKRLESRSVQLIILAAPRCVSSFLD